LIVNWIYIEINDEIEKSLEKELAYSAYYNSLSLIIFQSKNLQEEKIVMVKVGES
jgi:hypothetical protein